MKYLLTLAISFLVGCSEPIDHSCDGMYYHSKHTVNRGFYYGQIVTITHGWDAGSVVVQFENGGTSVMACSDLNERNKR
jgi:hypothetical protein